jgi:hypothetical protein
MEAGVYLLMHCSLRAALKAGDDSCGLSARQACTICLDVRLRGQSGRRRVLRRASANDPKRTSRLEFRRLAAGTTLASVAMTCFSAGSYRNLTGEWAAISSDQER